MEMEKEKILNYARDKFFKEGFYKTTMDEIASELQMSKKTIYKYFPSKEILVKEVSVTFREAVAIQFKSLLENKQDSAIEKLLKLISFMGQLTLKINDKMLKDLQKHLPDLWKDIDEFRTNMMRNNLSTVINQGKQEELFRNIPTNIILTTYISAIRGVVNPEFLIYNNFSFKEALEYTFDIIISGILTKKGKSLYNKSINRISDED